MDKGKIYRETIEELRERMEIGDTVIYERLTKVDDGRVLAPVPARARVKAKYPHLVEVECKGDGTCPARTLTYWEILAGGLLRPQRQ